MLMDEVSRPKRLTKSERREQILQSLRLQPHRRIADLSEQFGVTTETIRRDVKSLSRQGRLQRAYGGASAIHQARAQIWATASDSMPRSETNLRGLQPPKS